MMSAATKPRKGNIANVFLRNDYNPEVILQIIESLVEKKILRKSDHLIWSMLFTNIPYQKKISISGKSGVSINIHHVIDSLKGDDNPDFTTGRIINYSRQSKALKLKKYIEIGLLNPISHSEIVYEIGYPTNAHTVTTKPRAKTYLKKKRSNLQLISTEAIEKMGTIQAISNYIGRCVRLTNKIQADIIKTQFLVKSQVQEEPDGVLEVEATSLKNSSIVVADDLLLVDYIYSMIKERLDERTDKENIIENKFTFDLVDIAKDFGKSDSGTGRVGIYAKILRISSTEYTISADKRALWLMTRLGFLDEDGNPFKIARLRWLSIAGEQSEELDSVSGSRYVTISLPDFIISNLNKKSISKEPEILPMYKRDKVMLKGKNAGVMWTLNNYLMTMLAVPGYIHGATQLNKFLKRWQPYLEDENLLEPTMQAFLKTVTHENSILYVNKLKVTQAKKVSAERIFSLVGSFLVKTKNITPFSKQIRSIRYEITVVRLNVAEIAMCRKKIDMLKTGLAFVSDDIFEEKLNLIISRGGKHSVDKRQSKSD